MKMRILIAVVAFFTLSTTSQAQIDVTINPIGILFGNLSAGADIVISDHLSVEPTIGFGSNKSAALGYKSSALPISVFGKYYFNPNNGADKFYASVWLRFVNRQVKWDDQFLGTTNVDYSQTRVGGGLGIGYKIVSNGGIVFDIGLGAGRAFLDSNNLDDSLGASVVEFTKLMFNGKLGIGYRFGG